jgi:hypothetical protein
MAEHLAREEADTRIRTWANEAAWLIVTQIWT